MAKEQVQYGISPLRERSRRPRVQDPGLFLVHFPLVTMLQSQYNKATNLTAVPPAMAPRQSLRAAVFVDGNNWYHRCKEILNDTLDRAKHAIKPPIRFDLKGLCASIVQPDVLTCTIFCQGTIRQIENDPHNQLLYANQRKRFRFLASQGIQLQYGTIIMHPDGTFHEKGVDLRLAIDMIKMALSDEYDVAYLLSSDNDLVPAIDECRQLGKQVVYVGSSLKPSFGLQKASNRSILLQLKEIQSFLPSQQSLL